MQSIAAQLNYSIVKKPKIVLNLYYSKNKKKVLKLLFHFQQKK